MQYRKDNISALGFGCMRFSSKGGKIDFEKAQREIMLAYEHGVTYFDTAYVYPGSEEVLGQVVSNNNIRDKILISDKLPQYLCTSRKALERYFDEQLRRLKTDYIDYYLIHHMTDYSTWEKLQAIGIEDFIEEKKKSGRIRKIGFSYHGTSSEFIKLLHAYNWDSCLIQYNYVDEYTQAGRDGVNEAYKLNIPVFVMEPLRGGKLIEFLPQDARKEIAAHPSGRTAARWAFEWLWDQKEITCVLSGMNSEEMIEQNCRTASDTLPGSFTESDFAMIDRIREYISRTTRVNCTGCRYCMPCPKGIDIPALLRCYNHMYSERKSSGRLEYIQSTAIRQDTVFANKCIGCGKCEKHCPQELNIRELIKQADKELRPLHYKIAIAAMRKAMLHKTKKSDCDKE